MGRWAVCQYRMAAGNYLYAPAPPVEVATVGFHEPSRSHIQGASSERSGKNRGMDTCRPRHCGWGSMVVDMDTLRPKLRISRTTLRNELSICFSQQCLQSDRKGLARILRGRLELTRRSRRLTQLLQPQLRSALNVPHGGLHT